MVKKFLTKAEKLAAQAKTGLTLSKSAERGGRPTPLPLIRQFSETEPGSQGTINRRLDDTSLQFGALSFKPGQPLPGSRTGTQKILANQGFSGFGKVFGTGINATGLENIRKADGTPLFQSTTPIPRKGQSPSFSSQSSEETTPTDKPNSFFTSKIETPEAAQARNDARRASDRGQAFDAFKRANPNIFETTSFVVKAGGGPNPRKAFYEVSLDPEIAEIDKQIATLRGIPGLITGDEKRRNAAIQQLQKQKEDIINTKFEASPEYDKFKELDDQLQKVEDAKASTREERLGIEEKTQASALVGRTSLERVTNLANDQRDKEYERAKATRDLEIERLDRERKTAETNLKKDITARQKAALQQLANSGSLRTTGKGKVLRSSAGLRRKVEEDFRSELADGMTDIKTQYDANRGKVLSAYNSSLADADENRSSTLIKVEQEKIRLDEANLDRQIEAQKDLEDQNISWVETLEAFKDLVGSSPELVDSLAEQLRGELISLGVTDPKKLDNIIEALKAQAQRDLEAGQALTDQRERSNIPKPDPTLEEIQGELSAGAQNALRVYNSASELRSILTMNEEERDAALAAIPASKTDIIKAINFLEGQGSSGEDGGGGEESETDFLQRMIELGVLSNQ